MRNKLSESARVESLQAWYQTTYADCLYDQIWSSLKLYLQRIPVHDFVPVGLPLAKEKPIHINIGQQISLVGGHSVNVDDFTLLDHLPLETDSQTCLVYNHLLDVLDKPYQILREADRVLDDSGYLIIIGFNPFSLYGLTRYIRSPFDYFKQSYPWSLQAYSHARIVNWLRVLEFVPVCTQSCGFLPPFICDKDALLLKKTEPLLSKWLDKGGMVNVSLFRKNSAPLTPIKTRWKVTSVKMPRGKLQPSPKLGSKVECKETLER